MFALRHRHPPISTACHAIQRRPNPKDGLPSLLLVAEAVGVLRTPAPDVAAHISERQFRPPAKHPFRLCRVRVEFVDIALATRLHLIWYVTSAGRCEGGDNFKNRTAVTGTEIENLQTQVSAHIQHGRKMTGRKIDNVDVIPDTGAVPGFVVIAKDRQ